MGQIGLKNHEEASTICQENNSTLLTIHEKEENDFIVEFFKSQKLSNDVWIGVNYRNKKYEWIDGTDVVYQNWAPGSPKQMNYHCVQFDLTDESLSGKWSDVMCSKGNLVVCQKTQEWTLEKLKNKLLNLEKNAKNPVPIGFTYVQLPHEKEPGEIWPWMIWENVSKNYSGVFFRVEGGEAAPFGEIQMENTTRVEKVNSVWSSDAAFGEVSKHRASSGNITIPLKGPSLWIRTGDSGSYSRYVNFELSSGEVRPKNMAIKVWRRIS